MIKSIGLCVAKPEDRKKKPCVMMAYALGNHLRDIRMLSIPLPKKKLFTREDVLSFIAKTEKVKTVQYLEYDGKEKDIYVCRPDHGEIIEVAPRNQRVNRFEEGFAEIQSDFLKFDLRMEPFKIGRPVKAEIFSADRPAYGQDSYEYALVNAYNACLLGKAFSRPEFHLETGDNCRVKCEVRQITARYVDLNTLYVKPEKREGQTIVQYYLTEPINVIDGEENSLKIYRIQYIDDQDEGEYFVVLHDR